MNLLLWFVCAGVGGVAGEVWMRRSVPFVANRVPLRFVPGVGVLLEPHEEVRHTNLHDFWRISRTNRLGFLDREPIAPERAASSCHIALVGDSFVAAYEVDTLDKVQVRLEALAARERPDLDITTSAFGVRGTGQVQQIRIYDAFVRPLRPKVLVLQAAPNDYADNWGTLVEVSAWFESYAKAVRGADGRIRLHLPDGASPGVRERLRAARRLQTGLRKVSFLWSHSTGNRIAREVLVRRRQVRQRERWRRLSGETASLSGWRPPVTLGLVGGGLVERGLINARRTGSKLAPAYADALEYTSFALYEFAERAARDGSHLVLFLNQFFGAGQEYTMEALAEERGIPVVDQYRYIRDTAKGNWADADFRRDTHWNPQGHQWAAEALWEYLKARPFLCEPEGTGDSPQPASLGPMAP